MQDETDLSYLKQEDIGQVIAKGLAELYNSKPKFPIDYLSKWLFNYSKQKQNEAGLKQKENEKAKLIQQFKNQRQQEEEEKQKQKSQEEAQKLKEQGFVEKIQQAVFHDELIISEFPQFLKENKKLTGVYIGNLNNSIKQISDEDEGDVEAHLNLVDAKVINYIGSSDDHAALMIGQVLELEKGVTADVFKEKEAEEVQLDEDGNAIVQAARSTYVYVPDVVKEPKMHFFRIPRLGSYIAIPIVYNSCMSDVNSFDLGLEERKKFNEAQEELTKERAAKVDEHEQKAKEMNDNGENTEDFIQNFQNERDAWEDLKEPEFLSVKKEYVLCADTLGQDREISEKDRKDLENYAKLLAESWEKAEKAKLSIDIDCHMKYIVDLPATVHDLVAQYNEQEEQAMEEKRNQFEYLKADEKEYQFELDSAKLDKIKLQLSENDLKSYLLDILSKYRILKFSGILQNILYLLNYKREEINIPGTHILDWRNVSKNIVNNNLFEQIKNYNHRGAKPNKVQNYALITKIQTKIEKFEQEVVDHYNLTYGRMLKWLRLTCNLRKIDIEIRRNKAAAYKLDRETKMAEEQKLQDDKVKALEDKKNELSPEEQEQFNEEEEEKWSKAWDEEHPGPGIPEVQDEEFDCDLEAEQQA